MKCLKSVSTDGVLTFDHGIEGQFDLIVGADGAWSKVRPVLTDIRPSYTGISGFELHIRGSAQHHLGISRMIGRGSYFAYSDCKALQAQRQGDRCFIVYAWDTSEQEYLEKVDYNGEEVKRILLETFPHDRASELQARLRAWSADVVRPWPIYELPAGTAWDHKKGFAHIGNSAHVISPFSGEGVNTGIIDSLELAEAITESIQSSRSLNFAVERFERALFPQMKDAMALAKMMRTYLLQEDAPFKFLKMREPMGRNGPAEERSTK